MLLDLDDPTKIVGMSKLPLIAPETYYETQSGFRKHVIFPGGMILEDDGEVKIYYGASDTVISLLLKLIQSVSLTVMSARKFYLRFVLSKLILQNILNRAKVGSCNGSYKNMADK